ncbi:DUF1667 domain-containing protein [Youngiibacter multivorans]|uniref:CxxC motif-containing protein n=1 Tax=Youngiibacter multivorans TaxID=937251 RepID=A0ABS4G2U3_9CLOT|nr:DUF1667 domain-containing protein [Youngiibacter multivorans]MBP1918873.1 CxxC motif-containing protein [Youngiibacter multivorans]
MKRTMTCIVCPKGCRLQAEITEGKLSVMGNECKQGEKHAYQELVEPKRNIASSVIVSGGILPLVSVKLTAPIPKDRIFDVMDVVKGCICTAPVFEKDVLKSDILGLGIDLVATKDIGVRR